MCRFETNIFKMKKLHLFILVFLVFCGVSSAQEAGGMWIPNELNEEEMKEMGMEISAEDIFNPEKASIKDAIAHFGGGCTSEVISPKGLLLTNHHCGYSQIQSHSSVENDYLKEGFWAKNQKEELPNDNLSATFILDIEDVTEIILEGVADDLPEDEREKKVTANIEKQTDQIELDEFEDVFIRAFYKGNKYYQFKTVTYKDVRLVGAPPSSIGKFGADTDNWSWPRHVGDFALFRIYADKDNNPAEYSENNVPYKPKHHLPISIKGVEQDDFTFVFGFPGATDEYLPATGIEQILEVINPARIGIRDVSLEILDKKMREDDETRIKYASKFASIANYHKKWSGESLGLKKTNAVGKRKEYEKEFTSRISKDDELEEKYGHLLEKFDSLYEDVADLELANVYFEEAIYTNSESFRVAYLLNNLLHFYKNDKTSYEKYKKPYRKQLKGIYKNFNSKLDEKASLALIDLYKKDVPKNLLPENPININEETFANSIISGAKEVNGTTLTEDLKQAFKDDEALIKAIENDSLVKEINEIVKVFFTKVSDKRVAIRKDISKAQRNYMKAQMEVFPENKFFPDANSTLRVTYGKVDGYKPEDKPRYDYVTDLAGAVDKYVPDDYEFDMPKKLRKLQKKKKFGKYGEGRKKKDRKLPVNFLATNHTTGGNSGSPTLDKDGNLIGLNFDRVWEGTMSDINYDPEICRNIQVDSRYILFIIDEFADAGYLLNEMTIIE